MATDYSFNFDFFKIGQAQQAGSARATGNTNEKKSHDIDIAGAAGWNNLADMSIGDSFTRTTQPNENNVVDGVEKNDKVAKLTNETEFANGVDIETDEDLRKRFVKVVNNPSTSGNKNHYEEWALEVNGVGRAIVYPLHNGNGTVKVMIVGNDNKPVTEETIVFGIKFLKNSVSLCTSFSPIFTI